MKTAFEELEEYINEQITIEKNTGEKSNKMLVPDLLDYFTNNVEFYNKELEEENVVLKEKLDKVMEFVNDTFNSVNDLKEEME